MRINTLKMQQYVVIFFCCHMNVIVALTSAGVCFASHIISCKTGIPFSFCLFFGCYCVYGCNMWVYSHECVHVFPQSLLPTIAPVEGLGPNTTTQEELK